MINVLRAVWEPRVKIIMTLLLLIITQYVFTLYAYWNYENDFSDNVCSQLDNCFVGLFDNAFKVWLSKF